MAALVVISATSHNRHSTKCRPRPSIPRIIIFLPIANLRSVLTVHSHTQFYTCLTLILLTLNSVKNFIFTNIICKCIAIHVYCYRQRRLIIDSAIIANSGLALRPRRFFYVLLALLCFMCLCRLPCMEMDNNTIIPA